MEQQLELVSTNCIFIPRSRIYKVSLNIGAIFGARIGSLRTPAVDRAGLLEGVAGRAFALGGGNRR
jgi:hypothetical protein